MLIVSGGVLCGLRGVLIVAAGSVSRFTGMV